MLLIISTKSSLVFFAMDFGMFSPQFCTPQIRFATQKNNREYALAHPRFVILYVCLLLFLSHNSTHWLAKRTSTIIVASIIFRVEV